MTLKTRTISFHLIRGVIALIITLGLGELSFRFYDAVTALHDNVDVWVRETSKDLQEHRLLGYRVPPHKMWNDGTQADEFGMPNVPEALRWPTVDVVAIGDSYVQLANQVFFARFKAHDIKYHSLALFGYGPGAYNILLTQYGARLKPRFYLYFVYVGNDPGDVRRYESWLKSGKSWWEFNGGYFMPIERQGYLWGWRLFLGRAKAFLRNTLSRMNREGYATLKTLIRRDDAETVFEYVVRAQEESRRQRIPLLVLIIPRLAHDKPFLDPIAERLLDLCSRNGVLSLDLDPAFGDAEARGRFFAPDGHWNQAGIEAAWTFLWERRLAAIVAGSPEKNAAVAR